MPAGRNPIFTAASLARPLERAFNSLTASVKRSCSTFFLLTCNCRSRSQYSIQDWGISRSGSWATPTEQHALLELLFLAISRFEAGFRRIAAPSASHSTNASSRSAGKRFANELQFVFNKSRSAAFIETTFEQLIEVINKV